MHESEDQNREELPPTQQRFFTIKLPKGRNLNLKVKKASVHNINIYVCMYVCINNTGKVSIVRDKRYSWVEQ